MANVSGFRRMPSRSKAPEHRRIPKRKRELDVEAAATFWSAALLRRFPCTGTCYVTRRFEVKDMVVQIQGGSRVPTRRLLERGQLYLASRRDGSRDHFLRIAKRAQPGTIRTQVTMSF